MTITASKITTTKIPTINPDSNLIFKIGGAEATTGKGQKIELIDSMTGETVFDQMVDFKVNENLIFEEITYKHRIMDEVTATIGTSAEQIKGIRGLTRDRRYLFITPGAEGEIKFFDEAAKRAATIEANKARAALIAEGRDREDIERRVNEVYTKEYNDAMKYRTHDSPRLRKFPRNIYADGAINPLGDVFFLDARIS